MKREATRESTRESTKPEQGRRDTGAIKKIVESQGFGFIKSDAGVEHFFHHTAVVESCSFQELRPKDRVTFISISTAKGPRAVNVAREEGDDE